MSEPNSSALTDTKQATLLAWLHYGWIGITCKQYTSNNYYNRVMKTLLKCVLMCSLFHVQSETLMYTDKTGLSQVAMAW